MDGEESWLEATRMESMRQIQNNSTPDGTAPVVASLINSSEASRINGTGAKRRRMGGQRQTVQRPGIRLSAENSLQQMSSLLPELPDDFEIPSLAGRRSLGLLALVAAAGVAGGIVGRSLGGAAPSAIDANRPELAYADPVIRKGSVLMSHPGIQFAYSQQYFHKSVVLITEHEQNFDVGLILNRPSSFVTTQLGIGGPPWQVMFGGDVEGIKSFQGYGGSGGALECLHTLEKFAALSREIVQGVYLMNFNQGRDLVSQGEAKTSDFFLVVGYCGWGRGQLQSELNRGDWQIATVDSRIIIRELKDEAMEMRAMNRIGLDDGVALWRHIYAVVDSGFPEGMPEDVGLGDKISDLMLQRWVDQNLTPSGGDVLEIDILEIQVE
eukprot:TRINITY_DN44490_c0_g1_i1.p1 TRINITY_DN44490_c0_g1~~TRINITY_DN44490_c0_g1_i1.p1  ORF type:complete len:421 (+),score=51.49 TRINITY_DN44490_c0_g1_i1:119-1264(+)